MGMRRQAGTARWRVKPRMGLIAALLPLLLALGGCSMTQSAFDQTASNGAAGLAAAATTLAYVHEGKLTSAYARASFVNFATNLNGLDSQLGGQHGAPDRRTVRRLVALTKQAERAAMHPCIDGPCDWRAQVTAISRASAALLKASGG